MSGRLAKGFTRTFLQRASAKLHFQYISSLVCGSKAARKMWIGHFGERCIPKKCGLDILVHMYQNTGGGGVSFCNPLELSENSKLVLFQTKFVEEELEEKCWS